MCASGEWGSSLLPAPGLPSCSRSALSGDALSTSKGCVSPCGIKCAASGRAPVQHLGSYLQSPSWLRTRSPEGSPAGPLIALNLKISRGEGPPVLWGKVGAAREKGLCGAGTPDKFAPSFLICTTPSSLKSTPEHVTIGGLIIHDEIKQSGKTSHNNNKSSVHHSPVTPKTQMHLHKCVCLFSTPG